MSGGEPNFIRAVYVDDVYRTMRQNPGGKRNSGSVRRPSWITLARRAIGQLCLTIAVRADEKDVRCAVIPNATEGQRFPIWRPRWISGGDGSSKPGLRRAV
jgi:hypothetical protein